MVGKVNYIVMKTCLQQLIGFDFLKVLFITITWTIIIKTDYDYVSTSFTNSEQNFKKAWHKDSTEYLAKIL